MGRIRLLRARRRPCLVPQVARWPSLCPSECAHFSVLRRTAKYAASVTASVTATSQDGRGSGPLKDNASRASNPIANKVAAEKTGPRFAPTGENSATGQGTPQLPLGTRVANERRRKNLRLEPSVTTRRKPSVRQRRKPSISRHSRHTRTRKPFRHTRISKSHWTHQPRVEYYSNAYSPNTRARSTHTCASNTKPHWPSVTRHRLSDPGNTGPSVSAPHY